jgi:c(7)-type cytochrome triheme protein
MRSGGRTSPVGCVFRVRRAGLRLMALLVLFGALLGVAAAGEIMVLAFLKAAPNVPPVVDTPIGESEAPVGETGETHPARLALERRPIHDESNPDLPRLQRIDDATRHMKRDIVGFPDWMAALRSGTIAPRAGLSSTDKMNVLDLDVVMRNTKEMPYVRFPHQSHTLWLDCSNCHPYPFIAKAGANPVSMSEIFRGQYCGMCHDRVAFITFFSCDRCHSVPQDISSRKP